MLRAQMQHRKTYRETAAPPVVIILLFRPHDCCRCCLFLFEYVDVSRSRNNGEFSAARERQSAVFSFCAGMHTHVLRKERDDIFRAQRGRREKRAASEQLAREEACFIQWIHARTPVLTLFVLVRRASSAGGCALSAAVTASAGRAERNMPPPQKGSNFFLAAVILYRSALALSHSSAHYIYITRSAHRKRALAR